MKPRLFTEAQEVEIARGYLAGASTTILARDLGCSDTTILKVLRRQKVCPRSARKFDQEQEQEIILRYSNGESLTNIARGLTGGITAVKNVQRRQNYP
jgi:DNA invertase Pin-like site-specific DNA recombinase